MKPVSPKFLDSKHFLSRLRNHERTKSALGI